MNEEMSNDHTETKDYTETVSVRLTKAQVERLRQHASALGISQSDVLRHWIDDCDSEQGETVFADLALAWLEWLEQALVSDPNLARCVAHALSRLAGKPLSANDVVNSVRIIKDGIEVSPSSGDTKK